MRTALTTDSREADGDGALLASLEDVGAREIVERVCGLVEAVRTTALCVDNTLGNTLAVEMREQVYKVEVLEQ